MRNCSVDHCEKPERGTTTYCYAHYMKNWRYGIPTPAHTRKFTITLGQRFGSLVAIEYQGKGSWLCQCDCGTEKNIRSGNLNRGDTTTCGDRKIHYPRTYKHCKHPDCHRRKHKSGYCSGHYRRFIVGDIPADRPFAGTQSPICKIDGCNKSRTSWVGYCEPHYLRLVTGNFPADKPVRGDIQNKCAYGTAHARCRKLWGPVNQYQCIECNKPAKQWAYDGTDPTELFSPQKNSVVGLLPYSRFPEFYMPMCINCHRVRDRAEVRRRFKEFRDWAVTNSR